MKLCEKPPGATSTRAPDLLIFQIGSDYPRAARVIAPYVFPVAVPVKLLVGSGVGAALESGQALGRSALESGHTFGWSALFASALSGLDFESELAAIRPITS